MICATLPISERNSPFGSVHHAGDIADFNDGLVEVLERGNEPCLEGTNQRIERVGRCGVNTCFDDGVAPVERFTAPATDIEIGIAGNRELAADPSRANPTE